MIAADEPERALALLRRAMVSALAAGHDTTAVRFMAALALSRMGRHAGAAAILARLAEERPNVDRFRFDHAIALFALGRDDEAAATFRELWRKDTLPPTVRRDVERFLTRIRTRQRVRIDLDLGIWRDDNVNNAPERETVDVPLFGGLSFTLNERPVSAWVTRAGARLRWREPMTESGSAYVETRAAAARNTALGASAYDRTWANLSSGPRAGYAVEIAGRRRPGLVYADLGVERRWRGGDAYAASLWAGVGVDQAVAGDWRAASSTRFWTTRHDAARDDTDPHGRSLGLRVSRRIGPGWLTAGGTLSREAPKRQNLRWTSREASLAWAGYFGRDRALSIRARLAETRFDGKQPLFLTRREDRTRGLGLTLSHRALAWEGYLPEITLNWTRTASTLPLYDRELRTLRLGLRRLF